MPERKRFCYETCTKEEALADQIQDMKRYWVRLDGEIQKYFERTEWPDYTEFVRPVKSATQEETPR